MKIRILLVLLSMAAFNFAKAECPERVPICRAMHGLMSSFSCLNGSLPIDCKGNLADANDLINYARDARKILLTTYGMSNRAQNEINSLFDQIELSTKAFLTAEGDKLAQSQALALIEQAMIKGHKQFAGN